MLICVDLDGTLLDTIPANAASYRAALEDPAFIRQVDDDIRQAASSGISGVPAMVFAGKYLVSGAQPPEVLRQVTAKVREMEQQ